MSTIFGVLVATALGAPAVPLSDAGRALWSLPLTSTKQAAIAGLVDPPMTYDRYGKYESWRGPALGLDVSAFRRIVDRVAVSRTDARTPGMLPFGLSWDDTPADLRAKLGAPAWTGSGDPRATRWPVTPECTLAVDYDEALTVEYVHVHCPGVEVPVAGFAALVGGPLRGGEGGWAAVNAGDPASALAPFAEALARDPADTDSAFGLGVALLRTGARRDAYDRLCAIQTDDRWLMDDVRAVLAADGMRCGERPEWPPPAGSSFVATRAYAGPCTVTRAAEILGSKSTAYTYGPEGFVTDERTWQDDAAPTDLVSYVRDAAGVVVRATKHVTYGDGSANVETWAYTYDAAGHVLSQVVTHANGAKPETTTYTYDAGGRVTSETFDSGGDSEWSRTTIRSEYTLDAAGRITSTSAHSLLGTRTTATTYDDLGRVVANTTVAGPGRDEAITYDAAGRRATEQVTSDLGRVDHTTFAYDAFGNPVLATKRSVEADGDIVPVIYTTYDYACWAGR